MKFIVILLFSLGLMAAEVEVLEIKSEMALYKRCPERALFKSSPVVLMTLPSGMKVKVLSRSKESSWMSKTIKTWTEVEASGVKGCILEATEEK